MLKKVHDAARKELENVEPFVELGSPKEKIIEFAKDNDIDMIYLGATRKRRNSPVSNWLHRSLCC